MLPALVFPDPDPVQEAAGDGPGRRSQRAARAGREVLGSRTRLERDALQQLVARLSALKRSLQQRLLAADGGLTDFRRFNLTSLSAEVDQLIATATADLAEIARGTYQTAADLGDSHATEPLKAAQLTVVGATPGLDGQLVQAAFGNTVDLLTPPMQQFATDVKVSLRRVALAGDNRFEELARLRDKIGGAGFDNAQFRAERIIRTELSRTFNEATYGRLVSLAETFPFLRKGWRDSKDSRVRQGHIEAARRYPRGGGIPIADLFTINVYDERNKAKAPKLIGQATLRFPVDPQAQPAGRLAAAATILCRCNAFVDFDLADFAEFTRARVSTIVPAAPAPAPSAAPALPAPVRKKTTARPRVRQPKVAVPKAGTVPAVGTTAGTVVPSGPKVSAAIDVAGGGTFRIRQLTAQVQAKVNEALADIDSVHGDGNLPRVPVVKVAPAYLKKGTLAYYARNRFTEQPTGFGFSSKVMAAQPRMGVYHEVGHFLDHVGFDPNVKAFASETSDLMTAWKAAVQRSQSIQTLQNWRNGVGAPTGVQARTLNYLLDTTEVWARSYAQWMALRSGNKLALRELRNMQAAGTVGNVAPTTRYNAKPMGKKPTPDTWEYPWQWSDADFEPIAQAIDAIMERVGWRKQGGGS